MDIQVKNDTAVFVDGKLVAGIGGGVLQMFRVLSEETLHEIGKLVEFKSTRLPIPMEPE